MRPSSLGPATPLALALQLRRGITRCVGSVPAARVSLPMRTADSRPLGRPWAGTHAAYPSRGAGRRSGSPCVPRRRWADPSRPPHLSNLHPRLPPSRPTSAVATPPPLKLGRRPVLPFLGLKRVHAGSHARRMGGVAVPVKAQALEGLVLLTRSTQDLWVVLVRG